MNTLSPLETARTARTPRELRLPRRSAWLYERFRRYARGYVARHFHAVRVSRGGPVPEMPPGPLIVVLNHPSWWDPLIALQLAGRMPGRVHYAPIEARALGRYPLLGRLGFFAVEPGTAAGARRFLRAGEAILSEPDRAIWITAQGRFADVRERPVRLRAGAGHLARRIGAGHVLPLALEYTFWNESTPEALARFGRPIPIHAGPSPGDWTARIAGALAEAQDALAREATARDPSAFEVVLEGRAGIGGVYDAWRRARAACLGQRFLPEHGASAGDGR